MPVRRVDKSFRTASIETVRGLAISSTTPEIAVDANEWYWIMRFGHPLSDSVQVRALFSGEYWNPSNLSEQEVAQLSVADLRVLARSISHEARAIAGADKRTTRADLVRLSTDSVSSVRTAVGHNPETPSEVIAEMQRRFLDRTNYQSSKNPEVSEWRLERLWLEMDSPTHRVDDEMARNIILGDPSHLMKDRLKLAQRKHVGPWLRARLAAAHHLDESVALQLYKDEYLIVRAALAGNHWLDGWDPSISLALAADDAAEVRIALAGNSSTPELVLVQLANDFDIDVRCEVAGNHSLPHEKLRQLIEDQTEEVRRAAVVSGDLNFDELVDLDSSDEHRELLHARLTPSADSNQISPTWGDEFIYGLKDPANHTNQAERDRRNILAHESKEFLRRLAASEHASTRAVVARITGTPEDVLLDLADDPDETVRNAVCAGLGKHNEYFQNKLVWWYIREQLDAAVLSQAKNAQVRSLVAQRLDADTLRSFASDTDASVRAAVAANPCVPYDCLAVLADDPDAQVRQAAEEHISEGLSAYMRNENPYAPQKWVLEGQLNLPPRLKELQDNLGNHRYRRVYVGRGLGTWTFSGRGGDLAVLARVANPAVRLAIASYTGRPDERLTGWNPLGGDDLVKLMQDQDDKVRAAAIANISRGAVDVAGDINTPASVLAGLSGSRSQEVRRAVAANHSTPEPALAKLVRDYETEVRAAVAGNANTPTEGLEILSLDQEEDVLAALCGNLNAPMRFMEIQASTPPSRWSDRWARLAANPSIPAPIARKLAYCNDEVVRLGLASNPATPTDVLEVLSLDESPQVRDVVAERN